MSTHTRFALAAMLLLAAAGTVQATASPLWSLDYTLRITDPASRVVSVEAQLRFPAPPGAVDLYVTDVDGHYTPGYAQFVEGVTLHGPAGEQVPLSRPSPNRWRPSRPLEAGLYRLAYTVHVDHASKPSAWGLKETPILDASGGVLIGAALFVVPVPEGGEPDAVATAISTKWALPEGWRALTPWKRASATSQSPLSTHDLFDNFLVVGPPSAYDTFEAKVGDSVVTGVVRRGAWDLSNAEFWRRFSASMTEAQRIFAEMPAPAYLLVIDPLPGSKQMAGTSFGGGAARQSFHAMLDEKLTAGNLTTLDPIDLLVHETFHWWNPTGLPPSPAADFYWWHEGVTVYYSMLLPWRAGEITQEQFAAKLLEAYDRGERKNASRPATSLVEASRKVTGDGGLEYDAVYNLGAIFAFRLDLELRKRTDGRRSLDDLMRVLYARHKATGREFTMKDLVAEASRLGGSSMEAFVAAGVEGHERYDWDALLAASGLRESLEGTGRVLLGFTFEPDSKPGKVQSTRPDAPAASVLEPGDVIEAIDGRPVASQSDYSRAMAEKRPGQRVVLGVRRGEARLELPILPAERKELKIVGAGSDLFRAIGRPSARR